MKAIILAAGMGSRVKGVNVSNKCLLEINGRSILLNSVDILRKYNVDITVIVGYNYKNIIDELERYDVQYIVNPFYKVTNSIGSLWLARELLDGASDILLLNADTYFSEQILLDVMNSKGHFIVCGDSSLSGGSDFYLYYDKKGKEIVDYCGEIKPTDVTIYEYADLAHIDKDMVKTFRECLDDYAMSDRYDLWWEFIVYQNSVLLGVEFFDVSDMLWGEVDTYEDYLKLTEKCQMEEK